MAFTKIDEDIITNGGVTPLPDSPQLQPAALKAKFDEKGGAACEAFNDHIDELSATSAAVNIGAAIPSGISASANIQSILNALALLAIDSDDARHTHTNKTVLDGITSAAINSYDAVVTLLSTIESIGTVVNVLSNTELPTSKAVADYVTGYRETIFDYIYPVGAMILCATGTNPSTIYPRGAWTSAGEVTTGFTAWTRTA